MKKQTVSFAVVTKNKVVTTVGKAVIAESKIRFNGKGIRWYEDKLKSK